MPGEHICIKVNESTAARRRWYFACVDSTDGKTPETGLTFSAGEIQLEKAGGSFTDFAGTYGELSDGMYYYEASAAECNTPGPIGFKVEKTGVLLLQATLSAVVSWDPYAVGLGWPTMFALSDEVAGQREWDFVCVDDTDGVTPETGLTFSGAELQLTKNGAAFASFGGSVTELSDGRYRYRATAAELDTYGALGFKVEKSGVRLVLMQVGQVGINPAAAFPTITTATTAGAIRDRMLDVVEAISPDLLTGDVFRRYRNEGEGRFDRWCEAHPAGAFRRFQIRDTGRREPPAGTNLGYEWHIVTFEILVAYPQTARYGADQALDRDDTADDDFRQIAYAVGYFGRANFVAASGYPDATPLGCVELDRRTVDGVDFLVCEARFQYIRNMQG